MVVQLATRVDDDQAEEFRETTKKLGLSTADALRMFVSSFNEYQGFPYQVRVRQVAEPFENEREASDFAKGFVDEDDCGYRRTKLLTKGHAGH